MTRNRDHFHIPRTSTNFFLNQVCGVIHLGANTGQERGVYARHGLNVAWVEPIPWVFQRLEYNIRSIENQTAYQYLVSDTDDRRSVLNVSNNNGLSSSTLSLSLHKHIWPEVEFITTIELTGISLPTLVKKENLSLTTYDSLVLDTQGTELQILQGAVDLLPQFKFIKTEVADFESYSECCRLFELSDFLGNYHYVEFARECFASSPGVGSYYDVLYQNTLLE